jgi:hypothetical protein
MLLAGTAEMVALPYYLYNLLAHAVHLSNGKALSMTVFVTFVVVMATMWLMCWSKSE